MQCLAHRKAANGNHEVCLRAELCTARRGQAWSSSTSRA